MKVLVVEDQPDIAETLRVLLTLWGHTVVLERNGVRGLQMFQHERPSVVVSDIGMPRMNGWEMAAAIRELPGGQDVFLIALTAYDSDKERQRSRQAGFDVHLVKPYGIDELEKLLKQGRSVAA